MSMKGKKAKSKKQQFWERYTEEADASNGNYLCPLVKAAFACRLQYFNYRIHGEDLRFDPGNSHAIYSATAEYIKTIKPILQDAKIRKLKRDPSIRRFLNSSLENHNLPTRLLNVLWKFGAKNMQDVARGWHERLLHKRGMGNESIMLLVSLFDKNGCFTLTL